MVIKHALHFAESVSSLDRLKVGVPKTHSPESYPRRKFDSFA
jgi:hypothetical protein